MTDVLEVVRKKKREYNGSPDRLYVDSEVYYEIVKEFGASTQIPDSTETLKFLGMKVIIVPQIERIVVARSEHYPTAADFKTSDKI